MKNVELDVDGDILRLTIDCSKDLGPSKSGKTIMVASSEGTKAIPDVSREWASTCTARQRERGKR